MSVLSGVRFVRLVVRVVFALSGRLVIGRA